MSSKKGGDGIQTFLRIRPSKKASGFFNINELESKSLTFSLPENYGLDGESSNRDYINNTKLRHDFHFNDIIPMEFKQDDVFKKVGMAAVQNALDGFNSTIFAYGQTGSGKTFTITGGPERYADRGIIPRSVSMIYNEFRKRNDVQFKAYISYLELYNEQGYDLLDPSHETKALEDLPKVSILEDEHGNFHLKNLSMNEANTEEDALNLLFMGDTNRAIAETPMNMASSRSHCIFTVAMEVRENGSDRIRRSKLHLVDLAGSERIGKTDSQGTVRTEAKYINSSLFFLEMVIVALHEKTTKGRTHIPYRNSMMTSVLRDSLGGNCKTIMIATINPEKEHTDESLSTCRFAQRVSLIKNRATINEDLDPSMVIRRLKSEILTLREEIAYLKGDAGEGDILTPDEVNTLKNQCYEYVDNSDPRSLLNIGTMTLTKIKDAFAIMKNIILEYKINGNNNSNNSSSSSYNKELADVSDDNGLIKQVKDLKSCLLQRDNEIAILVNMVKKGKTEAHVANAVAIGSRDANRNDNININNNNDNNIVDNNNFHPTSKLLPNVQVKEQKEKSRQDRIIEKHLFGVAPPQEIEESKALMDDPQLAFEYFRKKSNLSPAIDENKEILREKYAEAKSLGEKANASRSTITYLKNSIESLRREKALLGVSNNDDKNSNNDDSNIEDEKESTHRRAIEEEKIIYKESFEKLRILKPEIEHLRKILEKGRSNLQQQFDQWYNALNNRDGKIFTHNINGTNDPSSSSSASSSSSSSSSNNNNIINGYEVSTGTASTTATGARGALAWGTPPRGGNNRNNDEIKSKIVAESKEDINEDIMAFYQAKDELLKKRAGKI